MDRSVQAETQTTPVGEEHRSLLREAFHAGASYAFGEKSKTTDAITTYAPDALYTGALFFPGTKALVASAAIGALNEVRTDSSWQDTAKDAVLGSAKGTGTKFVFDKIGAVEFTKSVLNAPIKGVVMGSASTLINSALSRSTYEKDGKFDFETGLSRTANSVLSPQALAINAATFGFASSASVGLNRLTGGLLSRSAGLSMLATGGTFGIASGGIQEFSRQTASGESFDVSKIASQALIHGAIDGLAAVPAGFKVGFAPRPRSDFGPQKSAETIPQLTLRSSETDTVQPNERPKGDGSGDRATDSKKPTSTIEPTTYEATMQNGSSIKIEFSRSHEHTPEAEPKEIITTIQLGKRYC
ncbi:MAG: hypothetical protein JST89_16265 [Cyanobacteria bacterium SZAS-4]|nr:hypothetical protein [Cyanobacteria bacterium SZAS-4]